MRGYWSGRCGVSAGFDAGLAAFPEGAYCCEAGAFRPASGSGAFGLICGAAFGAIGSGAFGLELGSGLELDSGLELGSDLTAGAGLAEGAWVPDGECGGRTPEGGERWSSVGTRLGSRLG